MPYLDNATDPTDNSVNSFVNDGYYTKWLGCGDFIPDGTSTAVTLGLSSAYGTINYPDTGDSRATANIERPTMWNNGTVSATVYFGNNTATAGNVFWIVKGNGLIVGSAAPTETVMYSATTAAPAQNMISAIASTAALPVVSTYSIITIRVTRFDTDASDTFANTIGLLGVKLFYTPSRR